MSALPGQGAARKKRVEEMTGHLTEELSVLERSVAEKRITEDAVAVGEKLAKQVEQLSVCVTELKGRVMNAKKTAAHPIFKLKGAEKPAEDTAYVRDGL